MSRRTLVGWGVLLWLAAGCDEGGGGTAVVVGADGARAEDGGRDVGPATRDLGPPAGDAAAPVADAAPACRPACEGRACGADGCGGNCGRCPGGELCSDGACIAEGCPEDTFECEGACNDFLSDAAHCGSCGFACDRRDDLGAVPECIEAECYLHCPGMEGRRADADFASDVANCGRCGNRCPQPVGGEARCERGECADPCRAGHADCGGTCTSLETVANCGRCGNRCPAPQGGVAACIGGECDADCDEGAGFTRCARAVCAHLDDDTQNCGACGRVCPQDRPFCIAGRCTFCGDPAQPECGDRCCPAGLSCRQTMGGASQGCCLGTECAVSPNTCLRDGLCGNNGQSWQCEAGEWQPGCDH
jgi:hypothetical protein